MAATFIRPHDVHPAAGLPRATALPCRLVALAVLSLLASLAIAAARGVTPTQAASGLGVLGVMCASLTAIVAVHELSHLITAMALGIRVEAFGLGFGPRLVGIRARGIDWHLRPLPLGGFVRLAGESDAGVAGGFAAAGLARRVAVYPAGPVANIAFAGALAGVIAALHGVPLDRIPQAAAGLMVIVVGTVASVVAAWLPSSATHLAQMPIGGMPSMFATYSAAVSGGPTMVLVLGILVSLSVGVLNLLPIPPLDGGHAAVAVARATLGHRFPERSARTVMRVGFVAVLAFVVATNALDLVRWLSGAASGGL